MPTCDVCESEITLETAFALATKQVVLQSAFWTKVLSRASLRNMRTRDPLGMFLSSLAEGQATRDKAYLVCSSCAPMFTFDESIARSCAVEKRNPPSSEKVEISETLAVVESAADHVFREVEARIPQEDSEVLKGQLAELQRAQAEAEAKKDYQALGDAQSKIRDLEELLGVFASPPPLPATAQEMVGNLTLAEVSQVQRIKGESSRLLAQTGQFLAIAGCGFLPSAADIAQLKQVKHEGRDDSNGKFLRVFNLRDKRCPNDHAILWLKHALLKTIVLRGGPFVTTPLEAWHEELADGRKVFVAAASEVRLPWLLSELDRAAAARKAPASTAEQSSTKEKSPGMTPEQAKAAMEAAQPTIEKLKDMSKAGTDPKKGGVAPSALIEVALQHPMALQHLSTEILKYSWRSALEAYVKQAFAGDGTLALQKLADCAAGTKDAAFELATHADMLGVALECSSSRFGAPKPGSREKTLAIANHLFSISTDKTDLANARAGNLEEPILAAAAREGHLEIAKLLVEQGAEVDAPQRATDKRRSDPPISWACMMRNYDIARYLADKGANLAAETIHGTLLELSVGGPEFFAYLIEKGLRPRKAGEERSKIMKAAQSEPLIAQALRAVEPAMVEGLSQAGRDEVLVVHAALERSSNVGKVISELTTTKGFEPPQTQSLLGISTIHNVKGKHGTVSFAITGSVGRVSYHAANGLNFDLFHSLGGLVKREKLGAELDAVMSASDKDKAAQEAEAKARQAAEAKARQEAEAKARQEAAAKARQEAEAKARQEAADKAKQHEAQARREAQDRQDREAAEALKKSSLFGRIGSLFSRKDKG